MGGMVPKWRFHPDGSANYVTMVDDILHLLLAIVTILMLVVLFLLSKNRYKAALSAHASRFFAAQQQLRQQQKTFLGSMEAEELVMRLLEEEGWRHVFLRRRVPISRLGHNREIDVVGVGSVILVVEVKNWRGYVWSNGQSWFQAPNYAAFVAKQKKEAQRGKGGGSGAHSAGDRVAAPSTIQFEDVQEDNVLKAAALRRYIENTKRIPLPDFQLLARSGRGSEDEPELAEDADASGAEGGSGTKKVSSPVRITRYTDESLHKNCGQCVVPVVVFTHPTVKLDPVTLKKQKYVFTMDTFRVFAREALRGNVSADAPNAVAEHHSKVLSFAAYQARRVLGFIPVVRGLLANSNAGYLLREPLQREVAHAIDVLRTWDLVFLHDGRMITGDVVRVEAPSANCMYERKHLLDIHVHWNSTAVVGLLKTLMYNEAGYVELILTTAKRLAVKKNERKPRTAQGNIRFTMQAKKHSNPNLNDRLLIKAAGSSDAFQSFALLDVKDVRLSHHLYESEKLL